MTQKGKEAVRWNAARHGIRSPAPVVPGMEKVADWEEHRDGVLESLQPEGHLEEVLAERVAMLSWRLHRVTRYETEAVALYQEKVEEDLAKRRRYESGPDHPESVRSDLKHAQAHHRLLKRLPKMGEDKPLSSSDAEAILWDVEEHTDAVAEGEAEAEELLESLSLPGVPQGISAWEGFDGWTAGLVWTIIEKIVKATNEEPPRTARGSHNRRPVESGAREAGGREGRAGPK